MRSAPIGAYFADDYQRVVYEAKASAEVTHAHTDGKTGAAAVALAAAWMVRKPKAATKPSHALIEFVLEHIPQTETFHTLKKALEVPLEFSPRSAASILGNGSGVVSSDTVPFCLWCAARHAGSYTNALWATEDPIAASKRGVGTHSHISPAAQRAVYRILVVGATSSA